MDCSPEQAEDYSTLLLQQEHYFSNDQPIINFIQSQPPEKKKAKICAWNQHSYDDDSHSKQIHFSPGFQHQKQRIQDFLSTIRVKNGQFSRFRSKIKTKRKSPSIENSEGQKSDLFLPLNNTLITFPKSRSQCRRLQNEQKIILQKLYRKRQKSKVIPKQISINPILPQTMLKPVYPTKNYLSKNRSFIEQHSLTKIYNPQSKTIKDVTGLKRKFASSYYKKVSGIFQINTKNQKLIDFKLKSHTIDNNVFTVDKSPKKVNSLQQQNCLTSPVKLYKTIYSSPKFNNMSIRSQKEFSIQKIKEDAKNSHLNRKKLFENNQIQLLGSTITKWKCQAEEKLKKSDLNKD